MQSRRLQENVRAGFIERMGLLVQGDGLPCNAGRIFAPRVFDREAIPFGELAETLRISRASVGTSLRVLEERGLVQWVTRPGVRQDYFQLAPDAFAAMLASALRRVDAVRAKIDATIAALARDGDAKITSRSDGGREDDRPAARLAECSSFIGSIGQRLEPVLGRIRNEKADAK